MKTVATTMVHATLFRSFTVNHLVAVKIETFFRLVKSFVEYFAEIM